MAVSMAVFTMNDSITKAVSSQMNFGQVMLVRGLFAIVLIAAFAWYQGALRPLRTLLLKPVALRVCGEIGGTISFMAALAHLPLANTSAIFQALPLAITLGAALDLPRAGRLAALVGDHGRLHRRAHHRAAGACGLQPVLAARAGLGRLLRAARSRHPADTGKDPVAVHHAADHGDGDDRRRIDPGSARRLDAAVHPFARPAGAGRGAAIDRLSLHHHRRCAPATSRRWRRSAIRRCCGR